MNPKITFHTVWSYNFPFVSKSFFTKNKKRDSNTEVLKSLSLWHPARSAWYHNQAWLAFEWKPELPNQGLFWANTFWRCFLLRMVPSRCQHLIKTRWLPTIDLTKGCVQVNLYPGCGASAACWTLAKAFSLRTGIRQKHPAFTCLSGNCYIMIILKKSSKCTVTSKDLNDLKDFALLPAMRQTPEFNLLAEFVPGWLSGRIRDARLFVIQINPMNTGMIVCSFSQVSFNWVVMFGL